MPCAKSPASGPLIRTVEIVSGPAPVFVNVTSWASDLVPTARSPNSSDVGDNVATPMPTVPFPLSAILCGLEGSSSPIARVADFGPLLDGVKAT